MKIYSFILAALIMLTCCKSKNVSAIPQEQPQEEQTGSATYLALGDSYTIGQGVAIDERWPALLVKALNTNGKKVSSPDIIATTGWTTSDLLNALSTSNPKTDYKMVSLLIGVNNQYQGRSLEEFRLQFQQLLAKSISYAGGNPAKVFVVSIPDWGVTPYGSGNRDQIALEIDIFNKVVMDESSKAKVIFFDITALSRTALDDPTMVAPDQLHFSGKMYQKWVELILPQVKSII